MTEFLHDVVRKQNLDIHMRNNSNDDWEGYFHPTQDPWGDVDVTQLGLDWLAANARNQVTDSGESGGGPF